MKNLHFLSNEGMLGDDTEGTVDGCHPNDLGMMRQAEVFAKALSPLLANGNDISPLGAPSPYTFTNLQSRSICAENPTGQKGKANKDKIRASIAIPAKQVHTIADIEGPGMIRHIWLTFRKRTPETLRSHVIRVYWDDMDYPSVEAPLGDFFGLGHGRAADYSTPYLGVSDSRGFNCFFPMPFSKHCRITIENGLPEVLGGFYYQINYTLGNAVTQEMGRFHAHFNFMHISSGQDPHGEKLLFYWIRKEPREYM